MKTLLLLLFSFTGLVSYSSQADTTKLNGSYQYLALGDSYTIGQSVDLAAAYPYQLQAQLRQKGFNVTDPKIIAVTGWTTTDLINAIQQAHLSRTYNIVTLLIGVNDQFQGISQADYRARFIQLLNTGIKFAKGNKLHVFVLSIPDYSVTPFAANYDKTTIATEINQFNAINKTESAKAGVNYLNITDISRMAVTDPSLITYDGLHPSAKMYRLWIDKLAPMVANKF